ncbi:DEAD/DEAH box helicase family protein [Chitinibacter tainanensis]|uniref:DEAD/DEAH box helicase family protein n=1 Tax=Chitinibacter tainanensis TaxID=230667 RepID=UPI0023565A05|nr:DEAD/DEAH box helicase family protein [Chitinibacter tainanensis]
MLMQDLQSLNFEPLRSTYPELANLAAHAEQYLHTDPESALVKLRSFAERMVDHIYTKLRLPQAPQSKFVDLLNNASFTMLANQMVLDKFHLLRKLGNSAAHGETIRPMDANRALHEAWQVARWLHVSIVGGKSEDFGPFQESPSDGIDTKAEFKREKKRLKQENEAKEAKIQAMLAELEAMRAAEKAMRDVINAANQPLPHDQIALMATVAGKASDQLKFSEDNTRQYLIDRDLALAGWKVPKAGQTSPAVGLEVEVKHQGTQTGIGYADYVLWDDNGKPLAVIEAKRTTKDARAGQAQAKDYADGLEKMHGQRPMIFCTNGHDIWVWDDAMGYPPRKVYGFYSKDTLQYRIGFQRNNRMDLTQIHPDENIAGRLYQLETLKRVQERFAAKHRKSLIVQATGTGKTRVAIALTKLMIEAKWAKRILFLCDRKELRKQAKKVFNDYLKEPIYVFGQQNEVGKQDARIYIGIYQGLINQYEDFDVGFFDLIIADESHRSIYNQYGDIFRYFDALQVGLTATPVEMVSRSTCQLFGCDYKMPTANYTLEDAVRDKNLVPFRVVTHTTKFLRDGIKGKDLSDEQIAQLEDQGIDPNELEFSGKDIDEAVFNKDTNRVILRNLMVNGIRDADGQLPGKSIIFARNIDHARLLSELFDELYPQFAGKFCAVIHSEEPRAEQLIDDFKGGDNCKNDALRIAISVDMLDTGIDVPEVVNLVFAKPVKSKVKFWQMIGRGTRLCPDLFGKGEHKKEFLIFDHWENFAYHEMDQEEAEPKVPKSIAQRRYETRLELAKQALKAHETAAFAVVRDLLISDAVALNDLTIAVRDNWQAVQQARDVNIVDAFAPATVQMLAETIAPLLTSLDVRGQGDALRWDILLASAQHALITQPKLPNAYRAEIIAWLERLPSNLNAVRAKAEELKAIKSDDYWQTLSFTALEHGRKELREIIHLAERPKLPPPLPPMQLDIKEDEAEYQVAQRQTKIKSVDARIYQQNVEAALRPLFDTSPVLQKIREGLPVSDAELAQLNSLIHTHNPDVDLNVLREFYADTAVPLADILRSIIGMDAKAVEHRFAQFAQKYTLNSQQMRFLGMLKDQISLSGGIRLNALFEMPFTSIHGEGIGGIFQREDQFDELTNIIRSFGEPITQAVTSVNETRSN